MKKISQLLFVFFFIKIQKNTSSNLNKRYTYPALECIKIEDTLPREDGKIEPKYGEQLKAYKEYLKKIIFLNDNIKVKSKKKIEKIIDTILDDTNTIDRRKLAIKLYQNENLTTMLRYNNLFSYLRIIFDDEDNIQWHKYNYTNTHDTYIQNRYCEYLEKKLTSEIHNILSYYNNCITSLEDNNTQELQKSNIFNMLKKEIISIAAIQYIYNKMKKQTSLPLSIPIKHLIKDMILELERHMDCDDQQMIDEMLEVIQRPEKIRYSRSTEKKIKQLIYHETEEYNWELAEKLIESKNSKADPEIIRHHTQEIKIKKIKAQNNNETETKKALLNDSQDICCPVKSRQRSLEANKHQSILNEYQNMISLLHGGCWCCSANIPRNDLFNQIIAGIIQEAQAIYLYNIDQTQEKNRIKLSLIYETIGKERLALFMAHKKSKLIEDALKILYDSTYENPDNNTVIKMLYETKNQSE
jgi:hypothetical protein